MDEGTAAERAIRAGVLGALSAEAHRQELNTNMASALVIPQSLLIQLVQLHPVHAEVLAWLDVLPVHHAQAEATSMPLLSIQTPSDTTSSN